MVRNESAGEIFKLFLHDICCHDISERMTFDIIGQHFTANMSIFNFCHYLVYGHLDLFIIQSRSHNTRARLKSVMMFFGNVNVLCSF